MADVGFAPVRMKKIVAASVSRTIGTVNETTAIDCLLSCIVRMKVIAGEVFQRPLIDIQLGKQQICIQSRNTITGRKGNEISAFMT